MDPLSQALIHVGHSKEGNSFLMIVGSFIQEYFNSGIRDNVQNSEREPIDPSRLYKILQQQTSLDPNNLGDAVNAIRRILMAIQTSSSTEAGGCSNPALANLCDKLWRGTIRQDIVGRKGSRQRVKSKNREMSCPFTIPAGGEKLSSLLDGLAEATVNPRFIQGFDWDQTSNYIETDLSIHAPQHDDRVEDGTWETFKTIQFESLPKYLLFHLDRFSHDPDGTIHPPKEAFHVPLTISMTDYLSHDSSCSNVNFSLKGAIIHVLHGEREMCEDEREEGGHYVSLHRTGENNWYLIDDDKVLPVESSGIVDFLSGRPTLVPVRKASIYVTVLLLFSSDCVTIAMDEFEHVAQTHTDDLDGPEDHHHLIGKRLRVKWAKGKWYSGAVCDYDERTGKHQVVYDDGDVREYNLKKKDIVWE